VEVHQVRRRFVFIEPSIDRGTQWVVFEPNDEAFFVKRDRTTTQDDWDNGRLICLIGVAPVKPAEFVIFRISQQATEPVPRSGGQGVRSQRGSDNAKARP
jgi:Bacteriophage tail sheath protein